jgi:hypothetical protein
MDRIPLPQTGATNATAVRDMPAGFTVAPRLRNFWNRVPGEDRGRGGQRAGLSKLVATQIANGQVQAIQQVNLASTVDGYAIDEGTCTDITEADNRGDGTIEGNLWLTDDILALDRHWHDDRGTGSLSVNAVCWHPDGGVIYSVINYNNGVSDVVGVKAVETDGTELWEVTLLDRLSADEAETGSPIDLRANVIRADSTYIYVAVSRFIYVLRQSDGKHIAREYFSGWSRECTGLEVRPDGKLVACFHGSNGAGTLYGGIAILGTGVGFYAADFRAGVALFTVNETDEADPLTRETFGTQLGPTDPFFEAAHGYFRFSEHMGGAPRGCMPTAIAVGSDNSIYVGRSNKGWGPNWDYPPSDDQPYYTVLKLTSTGVLVWAVDTQSIRATYTVGGVDYHSDRYEVEAKSVQAIAVDDDLGVVYAGGAVSSDADAGLFALDTSSGALIAKCDLDTRILQDSMAVMPKSHQLAVGGIPGTTWPDAGGQRAHAWIINPLDMSVVRWVDLGNVNCGNIKASVEDALALGTQYIA